VSMSPAGLIVPGNASPDEMVPCAKSSGAVQSTSSVSKHNIGDLEPRCSRDLVTSGNGFFIAGAPRLGFRPLLKGFAVAFNSAFIISPLSLSRLPLLEPRFLFARDCFEKSVNL